MGFRTFSRLLAVSLASFSGMDVQAQVVAPGSLDVSFGSVGLKNALGANQPMPSADLRYGTFQTSFGLDGRLVPFGAALWESDISTLEMSQATTDGRPVILQQPVSMIVPLGMPVSFTVTLAEETVAPRVQWKRNGEVIPGATSETLAYDSVQVEHEGDLTVVVTNDVGAVTSEVAVLQVIAPPMIVTSPGDISAPHGPLHEFKVTVTGRTPLTYQWQKNEENIGEPRTTNSVTDTLTVQIDDANEGRYRVYVSNSEGNVTSDVGDLEALPSPPVVVVEPMAREVVSSSTATTEMSVTVSGWPPFTFQWQKDGQNYGNAVTQASGTHALIIPARVNQSGFYRCVVVNDDGDATSAAAMLSVLPGPPEVEVAPVARQLVSSSTVTTEMSVTVSGRSPFTFQWQKDEENYGNAVTQSSGTHALIIPADTIQSGFYQCVVTNEVGNVTSAAAMLTVLPNPPVIQEDPQPLAPMPANEGTVSLSVSVTGRTPYSFQWQKGNENYGPAVQQSGGTHVLNVPKLTVQSGVYRCVVSNMDGTVTSAAASVLFTPNAPVFVAHPIDQASLPTGGNTMLSVRVTGHAPFTFQWQKDKVNYGPAVQQSNGLHVLTVPLNTSERGSYRCVVSNVDGSETSNSASVAIWPAGVIKMRSSRLLLSEGSSMDLWPDIFVTSDPTGYQWQFNNKNIPNAKEAGYHVPEVALSHAGTYRLLAGSLAGTLISDNVSVAVVGFTHRTVVVAAGKTVSFTVKTAGDGLSYVWRGTDGRELISSRYTGTNKPTLTIARADQATDTGTYYCEVRRTGVDMPPVNSGEFALVIEKNKPVLDAVAFPPGSVTMAYAPYQLRAANSPTRFNVSGLPAGLKCDPATGEVSGTPTAYGTFSVKVSATNPVGTSAITRASLTIARLDRKLVGTHTGRVVDDQGEALATFSLAVSESGRFTGKCYSTFNTGRIVGSSFSGQMLPGANGSMTGVATPFSRPAYDTFSGPVSCEVTLAWTPQGGMVGHLHTRDNYGTVNREVNEMYHNPWHASTLPATAYAGYYTTEIYQPFYAGGDSAGSGYATFTVSKGGTFTLAGRMPDGTAFTIPTFLTQQGKAMIHAWLYGYKGQLSGRLQLLAGSPPDYRDTGVGGDLFWRRPASTRVTLDQVYNSYFNGIARSLELRGARYLPPNLPGLTSPYMMNAQAGPPLNVTLTINGGLTSGPHFSPANLMTSHKIMFSVYMAGTPMRYGTVTFNPATGVFTGSATYYLFGPETGVLLGTYPCSYRGIVTRSDRTSVRSYGVGYFARTYTYQIFSPDEDIWWPLQQFPALVSGSVSITAN